jgi:hypothetical protein
MVLTGSQCEALADQIKEGRSIQRDISEKTKQLDRVLGGLQTMLYGINTSSVDTDRMQGELEYTKRELARVNAINAGLQRDLEETKNRNRLLSAALNSFTARS